MKRFTLQILCLLVAVLATAPMPLQASEAEMVARNADKLAFRIENAKAYVGIAAVKLSVSTLKQVNGQLIGNYTIVVPLSKKSNDQGRIVLELDQDLNTIGEQGGTLKGLAYSSKEDTQPNLVVCKIGPLSNKAIDLSITTEKRTICFDSSYTLIEMNDS
ncbi:hypothetical protein [Coraliomargarita akajimensis]|uniref:DUF4251 domain-containing protein n=1 Tax=Coraliomargarita akajimensis (strain DSM 45221 / IAM 15411 / JCM 23193 / KCTC 12865 / 04OKA010-24) TaxID=583355 RepID=D5EKW7_CORAD|nr:hypothetical protein [Coraliomargarita akajimensis]ADE55024.1 hypothetical protein Caka_2006 [Coraliomargarita akajimensis DSM 45221]